MLEHNMIFIFQFYLFFSFNAIVAYFLQMCKSKTVNLKLDYDYEKNNSVEILYPYIQCILIHFILFKFLYFFSDVKYLLLLQNL